MSSYAVIDPVKDKLFAQFVKLAANYRIPDHVLDAPEEDLIPSSIDIGSDLTRIYASPGTKQFPIHTRKAAALSAMYFDALPEAVKKSAGFSKVEANIKSALNVFGESWPNRVEIKKASEPKPELYLIDTHNSEEPVQLFPVRNSAELKAACEYYLQNKPQIPDHFVEEMSNKLLTKLASLSEQEKAELEKLNYREDRLNEVKKQAQLAIGSFYVDKEELIPQMQKMANFFQIRKEEKIANEILEMQKKAEAADEFVDGKTVQAFEAYVRKFAHLTGPLRINKVTEVEAEAYFNDLLPLSNESVVRLSQLESVKKAFLVETLGEEILDDTKLWLDKDRLQKKLTSLTPAEADRFVGSLKSAQQVSPIELDQSGNANLLKQKEWELLANANV